MENHFIDLGVRFYKNDKNIAHISSIGYKSKDWETICEFFNLDSKKHPVCIEVKLKGID